MLRRKAKSGYSSPERRVAIQLSDSPASKRLMHIAQNSSTILTYYYPNITCPIHAAPLGASSASLLEHPRPRSQVNPSSARDWSHDCLLCYEPQRSLFSASDNIPENMAVFPLGASPSSLHLKTRRECTSWKICSVISANINEYGRIWRRHLRRFDIWRWCP